MPRVYRGMSSEQLMALKRKRDAEHERSMGFTDWEYEERIRDIKDFPWFGAAGDLREMGNEQGTGADREPA